MTMNGDAAAGLAEDRRTNKVYHEQQERAVKNLVDSRSGKGETVSHPNQPTVDPEDPDAVSQNLGDSFQEIHHHHHPAPATSTNSTTTVEKIEGAAGGVVGTAAPWIAAAMAGPLGAALVGWWLSSSHPAAATAGANGVDVTKHVEQIEYVDQYGRPIPDAVSWEPPPLQGQTTPPATK